MEKIIRRNKMNVKLTKDAAYKLNEAFDKEKVVDRIVRLNVFNIKDLVTYELASVEREEITLDDKEVVTEYGINLVYKSSLEEFFNNVVIGYKKFDEGESFYFFK
jgi:Fe-S cluster assembly iron-binding protein IscA